MDDAAFASHSASVVGVATLLISLALVQSSCPASKAFRILGRLSVALEMPISSLTLLLPITCSV